MNRRNLVIATLIGCAILVLLSKVCGQSEEPREQPNIVLIMADDLGSETIGCYGAKDYKTPHIDALAAKGVRFSHCYSQPLCTPSRVKIMTGRYNNRNYEGFGYLNPKEITFGNILKAYGYQTCIAGKWQLYGDARTVKAFGFDKHCLWNMHDYSSTHESFAKEPKGWARRYDSPSLYVNGKWKEYPAGAYGPQVCTDFINSFIKQNKDRPFFVYYPMILPHHPFVPTPNSVDKHCKDKKQNFVDMVEYMDLLVGQIVQQLERQGVLDHTLILFTGDNGTHPKITSETTKGHIKGGKKKMTDAGTRVPLIAHWRGKSLAGKVIKDLVDFSDFLPTMCEVAGAPLPSDRVIDGCTFLPQILGRKGKPREWIFCHYWGSDKNNQEKKELAREFVRNQRWKLYDNGQMYDIKNDVFEQSPLHETKPEVVAARKSLQAAFETIRKR